MTYKLYYTDSKGTKRYLQRTECEAYEDIRDAGDWTTDNEAVALKRRWAEAAQGMILQIEENK